MTLNEWKNNGIYLDVYGNPVFHLHKNTGNTTIAFLHGYPSCSYDYHKILPYLTDEYSYIIHDHLGFGLSSKPNNYSYSLIEQAEIAMELWKKSGIKEIHLVAHDYGTSVANEIIVRKLRGHEPVKIKTVTFCNGSMHIELAKLKLVQRILKHPVLGKYGSKLINKSMFSSTMRSLWYNKSSFDIKEIEVLWDMLMINNGKNIIHKISQYNNERVKYWDRWIGSLPHLNIPTHILWAQNDPIAISTIAEKLEKEIPHAIYEKIERCGHYPMLEKPEEWIHKVKSFIKDYD